MKPIFLFALPRSGSTLLQRLLAAHPAISSAAEPWLLLPFFYTRRTRGIHAEYDHWLAAQAIGEFVQQLPHKDADYLSELRELALRLYQKAARPEATYFLDKTPRYHLIAEEILKVFPDAKFIFLYRHPLALLASFIEYFGHGRWNLYHYEADLIAGYQRLVAAQQSAAGQSIALRFEDLLQQPQPTLKRLFDYLELSCEARVIEDFQKIQFQGKMGDKSGQKYQGLSAEPLAKWPASLCNPLRRAWARRYLRALGQERLQATGYSLEEACQALDGAPGWLPYLLSDTIRMLYGTTVKRRRAALFAEPQPERPRAI